MIANQTTFQIGQYEYTVTKMGTRNGLRVAAKLANALAPSLSRLPVEGFKLETPEQLAKILEPLFANPDLGATLDWLCMQFAAQTTVSDLSVPVADGAMPAQVNLSTVIDPHFADRYDALSVWLYKAIAGSMSSFLRGAQGLATLLPKGAVKSDSTSPSSPATIGQSGASPSTPG